MKTIYFVRHAEPDRTVEDEVKRPLSLKGQKQSEELSEYFVNKRLKYIYCSPYVRTRQTANYISNKNNIPIVEVNALHERVTTGFSPSADWETSFSITFTITLFNSAIFKIPVDKETSGAIPAIST